MQINFLESKRLFSGINIGCQHYKWIALIRDEISGNFVCDNSPMADDWFYLALVDTNGNITTHPINRLAFYHLSPWNQKTYDEYFI